MGTTYDPFLNQSYLASPSRLQNFCPQLSATVTTAGTSGSITFSGQTGATRSTFKITNRGTHGAYIAWGVTTATAVASSGTPAANCDYVAAGAILTQDFQSSSGLVDTIGYIWDGAATQLEISSGSGQ